MQSTVVRTACTRTRNYLHIKRGGVELLLSPLNDYLFIFEHLFNLECSYRL
jgi:hypothetical protein